ncbi:hypothetical protein ACQ4PT_019389 [Festuca glaucescens]
MSRLSRFLGDSAPRPTRGTVHGGITLIRVHGGPGRSGVLLHASREHLLLPLASSPAPNSSTSRSLPIARFLPKSRANRRLTLAICADEEGEEAGERSRWAEFGAGGGEEEMGPCEGVAGADFGSEMERSRKTRGEEAEEGAASSSRRRCFSFCVGSFGPITVDPELVYLGAAAGIDRPSEAGTSCARGGDYGAAGADSGAEAWSEDCQDGGRDPAGSGASGHGAESDGGQADVVEAEWSSQASSIPVLNGGAESTRVAAAAVEQASQSNWALRQGPEGSLDAVDPPPTCAADGCLNGRACGFRSLVGAAIHGFGGNKGVEGVVVDVRGPSMASRAGSRVGGCPGPVVGMEEKEVELLFEQMWHIPQHLDKPTPREVETIKTKAAARVCSPPPPPPLPPDRPGLCYLGAEETELIDLELEEVAMADRGRGGRNRGRGPGGGRGDNWNRQQQNQQFQQNPQQQQQQLQDFQQNQCGFPFPPQPYGFVPGGMPPPWAFQGAYPQFPPQQFGFQSNQWIAPTAEEFPQNNQSPDGGNAARAKGVQPKQMQKKKGVVSGEAAQMLRFLE